MRTYSFYIETSINQKDWEMAVDKQQDQLRSWQQFTFEPRPVVFIKIVGTYNTANEIFHCVHFECPSQDMPKQQIEAQAASVLASTSKTSAPPSPSSSTSTSSPSPAKTPPKIEPQTKESDSE